MEREKIPTSFITVYDSFLARVTDDMYMEMTELKEKLGVLRNLEYDEDYSIEKVKNVMKSVVSTYKEPDEVNKEKLLKE